MAAAANDQLDKPWWESNPNALVGRRVLIVWANGQRYEGTGGKLWILMLLFVYTHLS
jgi:hypothetical protein